MRNRSSFRLQSAALLLCGLLLFLPMSKADVYAATHETSCKVLPGGEAFGVELQTQGVLVVGTAPVDCPGDDISPAEAAGIRAGDILSKINGKEVNSVTAVISLVADSKGAEIHLTLERQGKCREVTLCPVQSESEHSWKAGVWIRDRTAGIGTVTYYLPESNEFSGLGHGICDSDTGVLMPLSRGSVMEVKISSIRKGCRGTPGELKGYFSSAKVGSLVGNTKCGVYGVLTKLPAHKESDLLPTASAKEVHEGNVTIRCTLDDSGIHEYRAQIVKLCGGDADGKNFVLEVTDPELLAKTGGIVQGMSGSPVLQDGKLVGAVTHVLLDDPTRGYGIFIENMLNSAE